MPRQWFDCRSLTLNIIYTFHIILIATVIFSIINASNIKAKSTHAMEHTDNICRSSAKAKITQAEQTNNKCRSSVKANITPAIKKFPKGGKLLSDCDREDTTEL
jgi:hypothetical protein